MAATVRALSVSQRIYFVLLTLHLLLLPLLLTLLHLLLLTLLLPLLLTLLLPLLLLSPPPGTVVITTVSPTPTDLLHSVNSLDHAVLMVPELTECCTSTAVDVPIVSTGPTALSDVPVHEWTAQQVRGRFAPVTQTTHTQ
jgi:hypothetical protein